MRPIEMEKWEPDPNDPQLYFYEGQPTAEEVFRELEQRLDSMGMLPDEYFLMNSEWENGREIPRCADIFVTTDYGESEGIYLDGYLKWYEDDKPVTRSFFTGKTLGSTGADMDRMYLIASAITKAFHGEQGQYARYIRLGPEDKGGDMIVNLTPAEQRLFIDALIERRERMLTETDGVEKLLRRMTGSITAYMDLVGERPLRISDYDRASLAIRDGELRAFKELLSRVGEHAGELLIEAAGRAGEVGGKMCIEVLAQADEIAAPDYLAASQKAVETADVDRVKFLMEQAEHTVKDIDLSYYGQIIDHAYSVNKHMGRELIAFARDEWIAAAPSFLLVRTTYGEADLRTASALIAKGLQPGADAERILENLIGSTGDAWMAEQLLKQGMSVAPDDFRALNVCVMNGAVEAAMLLLDQGMDLDGYLAWRESYDRRPMPDGVIEELWEHAQTLSHKGQAPALSGPTMEMRM